MSVDIYRADETGFEAAYGEIADEQRRIAESLLAQYVVRRALFETLLVKCDLPFEGDNKYPIVPTGPNFEKPKIRSTESLGEIAEQSNMLREIRLQLDRFYGLLTADEQSEFREEYKKLHGERKKS